MKVNTIQRTEIVRQRSREWQMPKLRSKVQKEKCETLTRVGKCATLSSVADVTVSRLAWLDGAEND